jgi:hypothetical protein
MEMRSMVDAALYNAGERRIGERRNALLADSKSDPKKRKRYEDIDSAGRRRGVEEMRPGAFGVQQVD